MSLNKGRRVASRSSVHEASQIENEENDECRECKIKQTGPYIATFATIYFVTNVLK